MATHNVSGLTTAKVPLNETGKVRRLWFEFNTDELTGLAEFDKIQLVLVPKGARIHGGKAFWEAMGSNEKADFGLMGADGSGYIDAANSVADDVDFLTTAQLDVAAAGEGEFGVLQEDNPGYVAEKDLWLIVVPEDSSSTVAWAADKDLKGYVDLVLD
jgi:hypothetical protein